jgi:competence ComEA-like helix-hairpin-helix protein
MEGPDKLAGPEEMTAPEEVAEQEAFTEDEAAAELPELPAWLRDFAEPDVPAEEPGWELPAGRLELNSASLAQLERLPGVGFILAQSIVDYRETHGPFASLDDLQNVPGWSAETAAALSDQLEVSPPAQAAPPPEAPPEITPETRPHPVLGQAWSALVAGDIAGGLEQYAGLIRQEEHLDLVIHDLREAAFLYPTEIALHQTLGDAYLRANRLQEALDAYNKAEDLLD